MRKLRGDERVAAISVQVIDEMGNEITRAPIQFPKYWHWVIVLNSPPPPAAPQEALGS
jgi:hypothetical protein